MMGQQQRNIVYVTSDDSQLQIEAFSHIKKNLYANKLFCWIQQGDTKKVIKFYNTFPHLINQLYTPNHWNPLMYAVRYGNLQLIQFLYEKGMRTNIQGIYNQVSIIHAAVYSTDVSILKYVLDNISKSANPTNCQTSPLKIAMKTGNHKMVQLLICKGAYYTFGDVLNNLTLKQLPIEQINKYITLDTNKQISNVLVVEDSTIKDCPIKQTLRWARIRQTMFMRHYAQKMTQMTKTIQNTIQIQVKQQQPDSHQQSKIQEQNNQKQQQVQKQQNKNIIVTKLLDQKHKFYDLAQILLNDDYFDNILKVLVNKGDSILIKNDPIQEKIQRQERQSVKQLQKK